MREINVPTTEGIKREKIYKIEELSYLGKLLSCSESKKRKITYLEIPAAFDIETTNIYQRDVSGRIDSSLFRPYAFMYQWQFCLDDQVCFGRTWEEFQTLIKTISDRMHLDDNHRLVIWCHNLSFEWQFMRRFVTPVDGFYKESYKPLKVVLSGGIEFRDSLALSNMKLSKFCQNERNVIHYKLVDTYDYNKIRTAKTFLTEEEEAYCYNDVRGLCECIRSRMQDDTIAGMPMTSTGYVRREFRKAMRKNKKNRQHFKDAAIDAHLYTLLREAFRGGNTHANAKFANQTVKDVQSFDLSSSYPAVMVMCKFPCGKFTKVTPHTYKSGRLGKDYAVLMQIRLSDVRYVGKDGNPYIPVSKCTGLKNYIPDNGRIRSADFLQMTITDIDLEIINEQYQYSNIWYGEIWASRYEYLPQEFREQVLYYYRLKTSLKNVDGKEYEYARSKEKINSAYGMTVQRIDQTETKYNAETGDYEETVPDLDAAIEKYYKSRNSFLSYQWGVWCTAHARRALQDGINLAGRDNVYNDTDSIKCVGDHRKDFEELNRRLIERAEAAGAYADDPKGKRHYMGVYEYEETYEEFRTLGAKKYVVSHIGKNGVKEYLSTIAGVEKKAGSAYFTKYGIDAFKIGATIENSGHLVAYYNNDEPHEIVVDHCRMITASNIALVNDTYTIGVTDDYFELLKTLLDSQEQIIYTN